MRPGAGCTQTSGLCKELDFNVGGVGGKLGCQGAARDGLLENQLGHDKPRFGEQLRVAKPDDPVPDQGRVAVHPEAGQQAARKARGFLNPGQRVDADEKDDG